MAKFLIIFFISIAISIAALALLQNDGSLIISMPNYEIETSLSFVIAIAGAIFIFLFLVIFTFVKMRFFVDKFKLKRTGVHYKEGIKEITKALTYIALGDNEKAAKASLKVKKHLRNEPISNLLITQTTPNALDKPSKIKKNLQKMLQHEETKGFALKSLGVIAKRQNKPAQAISHFEKALKVEPRSNNIIISLIDAYITNSNYIKAAELIEKKIKAKILHKDDYKSDLAAINIWYGWQAERQNDFKKAHKYFERSLKLNPDYEPAIIAYAGILYILGHNLRAAHFIKNKWKKYPSFELGGIYATLYKDKKTATKVKQLEKLIKINPRATEGYIDYAEAAISDDKYIDKAENYLNIAAELSNSPRIYSLLSVIAEVKGDSKEIISELKAKAKANLEIPHWLCTTCNYQTDRWDVKCESCGSFNSFLRNNLG